MNKHLGVGIIGTGWVAGAHIDNFKQIEGCDVCAILSRDIQRATCKIQTHELVTARAYDDLDAFLADPDLDIVVLCSPHPMHPDETIAAAMAGKHIVIEKPGALDPGRLAEMVAAVAEAGVQTSVCFELRWIGLFENIKALIAQGHIGRIFYGETAYFHGIGPWYPQYPWNIKKDMGGDAFLTAGCHALDALLWFMDARVTSVMAMGNYSADNPLHYEYEPNLAALLRFENGSIGKCATSIECRQPYQFPILLQGDRGTIDGNKISTLDWPGLTKEKWATLPSSLPDSGDVGDHPYLGQLQYFVDCIRSGERPHNDLAATAHVHEVMFAIQQSLAERREVEVARTPGT